MAIRKSSLSWLPLVLYVLFFAMMLYSLRNYTPGSRPRQVAYSDFVNEIRADHVESVRIDQTNLTGTLKPNAVKKNESNQIVSDRLPGIDETSLLQDLQSHHVTFSGHIEQAGWWAAVLSWVIPFLFLALIYGYGMRKMSGGSSSPLTFG